MPESSTVAFYFEYEGRTEKLPVNPSVLPISRAGDNESADIIGYGEITIPKRPKLTDITIEGVFPYSADRPKIETVTNFKTPDFYVVFFDEIRENKKPLRFVASGLGISGLFTIENFEFKYMAAGADVQYTLALKEYRPYEARLLQPKVNDATKAVVAPKSSQTAQRANTSGVVTIGALVMVNGRLHRDSFGNGAGKTLVGYRGKINFIKKGRLYPYHVTALNGDWLGWVTSASVKLI